MKKLTLVPFDQGSHPISHMEAAFQLRERKLRVTFSMAGDLSKVKLLPSKAAVSRVDSLWKTTCFECFLKYENSKEYLEFNVATTGDWNAYQFESYRQGMEPLSLCQEVSSDHDLSSSKNKGTFRFETIIPATALRICEINLTAVLEESDGNISYWAARHPKSKPDFHDRSYFVGI